MDVNKSLIILENNEVIKVNGVVHRNSLQWFGNVKILVRLDKKGKAIKRYIIENKEMD